MDSIAKVSAGSDYKVCIRVVSVNSGQVGKVWRGRVKYELS